MENTPPKEETKTWERLCPRCKKWFRSPVPVSGTIYRSSLYCEPCLDALYEEVYGHMRKK